MTYLELLQAMLEDMKQEELAKELGASQATVSRWLKGQEPRGPSILKIHDLAVSRGVIDRSTVYTDSSDDRARTVGQPGDVASLEIHAGMGNGGLLAVQADDSGKVAPEYIAGHWSFPDQVKAAWKHMPQTYAFPVTGDSMSPTLESGSFVFVDTSHQVPVPEDIYVCDYGDGLMVKRLAAVPQSEKIMVISDSERYQNYELQRESVQVFGRVVAWFHWRG